MSDPRPPRPWPRWLVIFLILGLYFTLRGYHSRDSDQAYRLPLLLHRQDPSLFADDPFVRSFDAFNPHRGTLALLDAASRAVGLSTALAGLFILTFVATCHGLDRLARAAWPEAGPKVGLVTIGLVLTAKAGNIGTNHLFEAMLLDRLMAFALGWVALGLVVEEPRRGPWGALAIGMATLIHPSVGLQLAMLLGTGWVVWAIRPCGSGVSWRRALIGLGTLGLALVPGLALNLGQGDQLLRGLPPDEFRLLSVELQGPQHMLPHLWRWSQWLAWACYPALALLTLGTRGRSLRDSDPDPDSPGGGATPPARVRLTILLAINLAGLALAWLGVEGLHDLRLTLFQPFRMATICRGLALVALSERVLGHWRSGTTTGRARAALLAAGLLGDRAFLVVTLVELGMTGMDGLRARYYQRGDPWWLSRSLAGGVILGGGLWFLTRHDTESGQWPLLGALVATCLASRLGPGRDFELCWTPRRLAIAVLLCWSAPLVALAVVFDPASVAGHPRGWVRPLVERCRFAAVPTDDVERLALWCRDQTPRTARFIGPPGPKTFRLWSLRSVAFNRAASPYHAQGLADWSARFRDHVGFSGSNADLVRAYLSDRHGLERRYQEMTDADLAALAVRQGATHIVAAAPRNREQIGEGPLELLHVEGCYAVYRVRAPQVARAPDSVIKRD
jgi:hypothetical protein